MSCTKNNTVLSDYEQEVLYHLTSYHEHLDAAAKSLEEYRIELQLASYHKNEITDITLKNEMRGCDAI